MIYVKFILRIKLQITFLGIQKIINGSLIPLDNITLHKNDINTACLNHKSKNISKRKNK